MCRTHARPFLTGFYGATFYLGYRDDFDIEVGEIVNRIRSLEERINPVASAELGKQLAQLSKSHTHVYVHFLSTLFIHHGVF